MLSQPDGWEAPLAEVKNWAELKAWLETQPREVSVVFAARAALRVLPVLQQARGRDDFATGIVPPIFRAVGVAWVAAKYRTKPTNPAAATRIDAARAAAARAAAAVRTDAVIYVDAADAYAAAAYVEASVYADPAVYATSVITHPLRVGRVADSRFG